MAIEAYYIDTNKIEYYDHIVFSLRSTTISMEFAVLSNALFNGNEVRIYGTIDNPLFVANDIGAILGIKNVRDIVSKFEGYEKEAVGIPDGLGATRLTTVLTESGLYTLVLKSKKAEAREFKRWLLLEVLPSLRKTGTYTAPTVDARELERKLEESQHEVERLKLMHIPKVIYHNIDLNDFIDHPCIYLIHLIDNDYKFGESGDIDTRYYDHVNTFKKEGCKPQAVKIWKCATMKIMTTTEKMIKRFAKYNNLQVAKYGKTEIIVTNDIDTIVENIDKWVRKQNEEYVEIREMRKLEMEFQSLQFQLNTQLKMKRLEFATLKFRVLHGLPILDHPESQIVPIRPIQQPATQQLMKTPQYMSDDAMFDNVAESGRESEDLEEFISVMKSIHGDVETKTIDNTPQVIDVTPQVNVVTPKMIEAAPVPIIVAPKTVAVKPKAKPKAKAKVVHVGENKDTIAQKWISENLPNNEEITTVYYKLYRGDRKHYVDVSMFGKYVRKHGYDTRKRGESRYWIRDIKKM